MDRLKAMAMIALICSTTNVGAWEYRLPEFSPAECRAAGVLVPEGFVIQGQPVVVAIANDTRRRPTPYHAEQVTRYCPEVCLPHDGCAEWLGRARGVEQWKIYYRSPPGFIHAKCHAEFQVFSHSDG